MKNLLAKLLTLTTTFLLIFGTLPASAFVVETTQRSYYANGDIKSISTLQNGVLQQETNHYDAMGNCDSGTDKSGKPFWATYDAFGNRQTYTAWSGDGFATTYSAPVVENGVMKGFVSFTLDGTMPMTYATFSQKYAQFTVALRSSATSVDPQAFFPGLKDNGITGSGPALMSMFGSAANLAKIFKPGWDRVNAANKAAALKDWDPAEHKPSESVSYTSINENPQAYANAVWAAMASDPNATVSIAFGGEGNVTGITVDHPRGNPDNFKPGTTSCKVNGTDPIVSGQVMGFTTINGQQYMIVSPSQINMFQNANYNDGFVDANAKPDEVIYVAVTDNEAKEIAEDMAEHGNMITIAGDVVTSVDGHATMKMNDGGYATGKSVQETQSGFINANENGKSAADQQAFYARGLAQMKDTWDNATTKQKSDWRAGWALIESGLQ